MKIACLITSRFVHKIPQMHKLHHLCIKVLFLFLTIVLYYFILLIIIINNNYYYCYNSITIIKILLYYYIIIYLSFFFKENSFSDISLNSNTRIMHFKNICQKITLINVDIILSIQLKRIIFYV